MRRLTSSPDHVLGLLKGAKMINWIFRLIYSIFLIPTENVEKPSIAERRATITTALEAQLGPAKDIVTPRPHW
jgi:hypothetical protein